MHKNDAEEYDLPDYVPVSEANMQNALNHNNEPQHSASTSRVIYFIKKARAVTLKQQVYNLVGKTKNLVLVIIFFVLRNCKQQPR